MSGITTDPNDPRLGRGVDKHPREQNEVYLVLSEEERKKGFVRPFRDSYVHVGPEGPKYPLRDLTAEENERYDRAGFVKYEVFPESESPVAGRFWTQADLDKAGKGCGTETVMGQAIAATYARDPTFYGSTYCVHCRMHLPVGEFVWSRDGQRVGS